MNIIINLFYATTNILHIHELYDLNKTFGSKSTPKFFLYCIVTQRFRIIVCNPFNLEIQFDYQKDIFRHY